MVYCIFAVDLQLIQKEACIMCGAYWIKYNLARSVEH